ncbi:MAG: hypothetical protein R6U35_03855 [Candidatus Humimicrobiaceae bacterium]
MANTIDTVLRIIIYLMFFAGIWLALGKKLATFIREGRGFRFKNKAYRQPENKFYAHIRMLIMLSIGKKGKDVVFYFMLISVVLFVVPFIVFVGLFGLSLFFILISVFLGFLPYIYLRFRFKSIQLAGSYEAENLLSELTNMYKISDFNMLSAIDKTIANIKRSPFSKKALFILSLKIKDYQSREELRSAIDFFVATFGTEWATLLGMSIFESVASGNDVSASLDEILSNLKEIKASIEKDKRANYEAFNMVKFVVPITYVLTVFVSVRYFGLTLGQFFYYQIYTGLGIKFFIAIIILSVISFWSMHILSKPKFDF